ncbi:MAG: NAD(P)/FAD-dependent oxidoreductase [archaeon]
MKGEMELNEFDVIVVGAGPAGISAAEKCAEKKLRVLLLEKDQEIGVPKRCAEGLGLAWFKRLKLKPDKQWAIQPIRGATLYSPSGKKLKIKFSKIAGYVLERKMFEKFLAKRAARKGVKILAKATVKDVIKENGFVKGVKATVMGEKKTYYCKIVIAADGIESRIARLSGLNTTNTLFNVDSGFQYEMAGIDFGEEDLIHLYFGAKVAKRGYVWIFPKGKDCANVGVGILGSDTKTAKEYLDNFIEATPGLRKGSIIEVNAGCIPLGGFLEKHTMNGLIVVGDAAHHVNPIHGGGIGIAMESGALAAEICKKAFNKKDFSDETLGEFNSLWYEKRGNQLKNILKRRKMLEALSDKDFETLVSSLTGDEILKVAEGNLLQSAKIISTKLIKNPGLMKLLLKLLR